MSRLKLKIAFVHHEGLKLMIQVQVRHVAKVEDYPVINDARSRGTPIIHSVISILVGTS